MLRLMLLSIVLLSLSASAAASILCVTACVSFLKALWLASAYMILINICGTLLIDSILLETELPVYLTLPLGNSFC